METEKEFGTQMAEKIKENVLKTLDHKVEQKEWAMKNWRSWGSWFSWGSPVGLGLFIISIGVFLVLLHYAGFIK